MSRTSDDSPGGKVGAARFMHVWQLRDGQAYRFETIFDTHSIWLATR